MLPIIEKLLILQDRDHRLHRARTELGSIGPQRQTLQTKAADVQTRLDAVKLRGKQIESERKRLELDAEAKKAQIAKYSLQQFQTKKNEEYEALAHEIELCQEAISKLEDQQLELMEQADLVAKDIAAAAAVAKTSKREVDTLVSDLAGLEINLQKQIADLEADRVTQVSDVDPSALNRYERLLKSKGDSVVVSIEHGACGGCHMKLTTQTVRTCQGMDEITTCPHCGRILYYERGMDLVAAD